ncbi:hypothetical protein LINGRAHAP2_LOCUS35065 [Linum grandiflorum]
MEEHVGGPRCGTRWNLVET